MDKEKFYGTMGARSQTASSKRNSQLRNWDKSDTNKQPDTIKSSRETPRVQFGDSVVFLAAAQSGDIEEVERLLQEGADVNTVNADGLTGLHQCCIDDDFEMVQTLVRHGANVDVQDNEGWSPLHAAASCEHEHIVRFLLESNAHPALVNNEGDTPLDLAEDYEEIAIMISSYIETNNIDVDAAKNREEAIMLEDVTKLKNDLTLTPPMSPGGATPLHIASAKGYLSVMRVLLSMKVDVDALDDDGWTPLHAAIYWRNMESAELLVTHGADTTKTTKVGDTIEDLVDPEYADLLDSLKKLKEEHNNRHRRCAMPSRSSRPSLTHTNSREDIGNSKSPNLLRRRSSKERSIAVHRLDKEREKFPDLAETSTENVNSSPLIERKGKDVKAAEVSDLPSSTLPSQNVNHNTNESKSRELAQENNNNAKEEALYNDLEVHKTPPQSIAVNNQSPQFSSSDNSPANSPSGSPQNTGQIIGKMAPGVSTKSPKTAKRIGMSPNMMKRVGLWESQKTLPTPLAASTPSTTESQKPTTPSTSDIKRYSFQPKPISDTTPGPRSMSFDHSLGGRTSLGSRRTTYDTSSKRASYDERKFKDQLPVPNKEGGTYKASSLPRGATISPVQTPVVSSSLPRGSKINTAGSSTENKDGSNKKSLSTPDERLERNGKENVDGGSVVDAVSSSGHPTPSSATGSLDQEGGGRNESREVSVDSTGSNRSTTEGSETKRKQHARRSRQQRQPTQPVDNEILQRLLQQDKHKAAAEEKEKEKAEEPQSTESSPETKQKSGMSAYRPSARPSPRPFNPSQNQPPWTLPDKITITDQDHSPVNSPPTKPKTKSTTTNEDSPSTPSESTDDKSLNALHPRTKSTTRRRPKKERRSTGLPFEADQDEHIPDELAKIIVRKPVDILSADSSLPDHSPQSSMSEDYPESLGDSSISEEMSRLKKQLFEEQEHCQQLLKEKSEMENEVTKLKSKVSELNRRHGDATRAYEQEKREREQKEARITELEGGSKNLQDLKKECQRLKDENSALIRVIGKLSRSPLPSSAV